MATLTPTATVSTVVLPITGTLANVDANNNPLPFSVYPSSSDFYQGCVDQVGYTYKMLGGDVLDIELTEYNVYAAYEISTLEYSYLVNLHQAKNSLGSALGSATGSFDSKGELTGSLSTAGAETAFPQINFGYLNNLALAFSNVGGQGGTETVYSSSFDITVGQQEYDLQSIVANNSSYSGSLGNQRVLIKKVFYRTGKATWALYGIYGGLNVVGNFLNFNTYSNDTAYEIMPTWESKLRVMSLKDRMYTRASHFTFSLRNNKLRLFPAPTQGTPTKMWFEFVIPNSNGPWKEVSGSAGTERTGVNNINTLPFANLPYESINSMGKNWIRGYALALAKEMLGRVRSKLGTLPIPGGQLTLDGPALLSEAKDEKDKLKEELKKILDETTYVETSEREKKLQDNTMETLRKMPMAIYWG